MTGPYKKHRVGKYTIQKVEEQPLRNVPKTFVYPTATERDFENLADQLAAVDMETNRDDLVQSIHTWVVQTPRHVVLIDTASGNDKPRPQFPLCDHLKIPYLERLRDETGFLPEDIDYVFNTHLHVDHSGWNTVLRDGQWVPTFPNARYVFARAEVEYYGSPASHNDVNIPSRGVFEDSIHPVIEAGLVDLIEPTGGRYLDDFLFIPTRGHSIGHMSIQLTSEGQTAIFGGDLMHHPTQVLKPHLSTVFCEFLDDAVKSRALMLDRLAEENALYLSTHFPGSSAGFVARTDEGFRWTYA